MEELLKSDIFLIVLMIIIFILAILYIVNTIKLSKIEKNYSKFINKFGENTNIEEDLRNYVTKVEAISEENELMREYVKNLNMNMKDCIQKVGIVRYSAFSDVGSDLSFTLALLDENDNGVVLNGIYSSDSSNIYAKPVIKGTSKYALSDEEKKAIEKAKISEK